MSVPPTAKSGPAQLAAYWALRTALVAPLAVGPAPALSTARALGRAFGSLPFNRKRVDRAVQNIAVALPGVPEEHRRELVLRSYEHLAMLAVEVSYLPRLITEDSWPEHVDIGPTDTALRALFSDRPAILITGHCGNWEILGATMAALGFPMHALYRPLDSKPLDDWVRRTRSRQGTRLLDKFGATEEVPTLLERKEPVGFVADQNAGDRGLFVPFMGRLASTYKTIGLVAMRHRAVLVCGVAHRRGWDAGDETNARGAAGLTSAGATRRVGGQGLRYRLNITDVIWPEDYEPQPDPLFYLTARYRRAIERAIAPAPEQYLWMHRMWKSRPPHERAGKPFPPKLREKIAQLPWMIEDAVDALVEQSARDAATLARLNTDRLP